MTIAAAVMFVNGLPFLITLSRAIKLVTVEFLPSHTAKELCNKLITIKKLYRRGGFNCRKALMDMDFEKLEQVVEDMTINTTTTREHVGKIERTIRTCKERRCSVMSELPYKKYMPDQFVIHLIYFVVMWMNAFPANINKAYKTGCTNL